MKKTLLTLCLSCILMACSLQPALAAISSTKPNLVPFDYLVMKKGPIQVYMDKWGAGYVFDSKRNIWLDIIKPVYGNIQPAYTKVSGTMALIYGNGVAAVYDTQVGNWVINNEVMKNSEYLASFSRSADRTHAAQLNDGLALAAGTNWICAYDYSLKKWVNYKGTADDSASQLNQNMQLGAGTAKVKVLNGPFVSYAAGKATWTEQR